MKTDWLKHLKKISPEKIGEAYFDFLEKKAKRVLLLFLFLIFLASLFLWYRNVYRSDWDEIKKQSYINSREREIILNENKLDDLIQEKIRREENFQRQIEAEDIFRLSSGERGS